MLQKISSCMAINKTGILRWAMIPLAFMGCVSETESDLSSKPRPEKSLLEIFTGMEKLSVIEDIDPEIEQPPYQELFLQASSFRILEDLASEDPMPVYLKELFLNISRRLEGEAPDLKQQFDKVNLNYLVNIVDPRIPIDPQLELVLKRILDEFQSDLSLMEVPEVDGVEELKLALQDAETAKRSQELVQTTQSGEDEGCALEVYTQYGSGARTCALDYNQALEMLENNYLRRLFEAELRFEERNRQLSAFELEQLPVVVEQFRTLLTAIRKRGSKDEIHEIRTNLGFLATAYAYHLRTNLPLWHDYGAQLIELYYLKELELFAAIREEKEIEAEKAFQHCIDWVNNLIVEEVNKSCPGDEPILY